MLHSSFFVLSQIFFFSIHIFQTHFAKQFNSFDFCSFIHALVTTVTSHYVLWKHPSKIKNIFDISDVPMDSYAKTFFTYVPIFSMAYGVYDIFTGLLQKRWDFFLHGCIMLLIIFSCYVQDSAHIVMLPLTTEISTIFLAFRNWNSILLNSCFALTFFLYRLVLLPLVSFYMIGKVCLNSVIASTLSIGQGTLNSLNGMWGYKIFKLFKALFTKPTPVLLLEYIKIIE